MIDKLLIALIRVYQRTLSRVLLALFGPACRFEPSCSRYAIACLEGHGALRGTLLSAKRLCKCHPFHPGGYDPPPPPPPGRPGSGRALTPLACQPEAGPREHETSAADAPRVIAARLDERPAAARAAVERTTKRHETAA